MKHVTVFDIDGTVADLSHRIHHIRNLPSGQKPDWDSFFGSVLDDKPIYPVIDIVHMHMDVGKPFIFMSGRNEVCRWDTELWLYRYGMAGYEKLYMRGEQDFRPDFRVKKDLLNTALEDGFTPNLIFDDRKQVVNMWRALGYQVAQVAEGDF